ncbi:hypothetical protein EV421DRAFT_1743604 [Armillaria borealis]|uniref:Uncharacterized protein n=1 Tax=Armillaria borealis TaxID=47425 RepID=A0AA39MDL0_9AGAR|nr:hypothetical protein EV421DRAFT_1743604 [Armillaria borealis]
MCSTEHHSRFHKIVSMQPTPLKPALPSSSGIDPNQDGISCYEDGPSSPATVLPETYPQPSISATSMCPGTPLSLYETVCMESPSDRSSCIPISTDTSRQTLPQIALKGTTQVQVPVELYLLRAKDLDLQFSKQIRGLNPWEYLEKLYKRFLRKFQSSVPGAMFEIDEEEEALQKLLSDIDLCVDGVLNVAGIGKRLQCVQNIFCCIQEVHGWIVELQMHVFAEGREYLVREHDNMALMYQREW